MIHEVLLIINRPHSHFGQTWRSWCLSPIPKRTQQSRASHPPRLRLVAIRSNLSPRCANRRNKRPPAELPAPAFGRRLNQIIIERLHGLNFYQMVNAIGSTASLSFRFRAHLDADITPRICSGTIRLITTWADDLESRFEGSLGLPFVMRHQARNFQLLHGRKMQAIQRATMQVT